MFKSIFIIIGIIILTIALLAFLDIANENLQMARIDANGALAIARCKSFYDLIIDYKNKKDRYPSSLEEGLEFLLGKKGLYYLKEIRESGKGYGYYYELTGTGFSLRAVPKKNGKTGRFIFYMDETKNIQACDINNECSIVE